MEIVVLDFETTGLFVERHRVIEIGAVILNSDNDIIDTYQTLCKPIIWRPLPSIITQITGITDKMLIGQPTTESAMEKLYEFIGNRTIVCHNASFDSRFLIKEMERIGKVVLNQFMCTLLLSRRIQPEAGCHKLSALKYFIKFEAATGHQSHRALDDVLVTVALWKHLIARLRSNVGAIDAIHVANMFRVISCLSKAAVIKFLEKKKEEFEITGKLVNEPKRAKIPAEEKKAAKSSGGKATEGVTKTAGGKKALTVKEKKTKDSKKKRDEESDGEEDDAEESSGEDFEIPAFEMKLRASKRTTSNTQADKVVEDIVTEIVMTEITKETEFEEETKIAVTRIKTPDKVNEESVTIDRKRKSPEKISVNQESAIVENKRRTPEKASAMTEGSLLVEERTRTMALVKASLATVQVKDALGVKVMAAVTAVTEVAQEERKTLGKAKDEQDERIISERKRKTPEKTTTTSKEEESSGIENKIETPAKVTRSSRIEVISLLDSPAVIAKCAVVEKEKKTRGSYKKTQSAKGVAIADAKGTKDSKASTKLGKKMTPLKRVMTVFHSFFNPRATSSTDIAASSVAASSVIPKANVNCALDVASQPEGVISTASAPVQPVGPPVESKVQDPSPQESEVQDPSVRVLAAPIEVEAEVSSIATMGAEAVEVEEITVAEVEMMAGGTEDTVVVEMAETAETGDTGEAAAAEVGQAAEAAESSEVTHETILSAVDIGLPVAVVPGMQVADVIGGTDGIKEIAEKGAIAGVAETEETEVAEETVESIHVSGVNQGDERNVLVGTPSTQACDTSTFTSSTSSDFSADTTQSVIFNENNCSPQQQKVWKRLSNNTNKNSKTKKNESKIVENSEIPKFDPRSLDLDPEFEDLSPKKRRSFRHSNPF